MDDLSQTLICFAGSESPGKVKKFRISPVIPLFQQVFQNILPDQGRLPLICHPESRIQPDPVKMAADHIQAESVDGCNHRMGSQSGLPLLKLADLMTDGRILYAARDEAQRILAEDPTLSRPENRLLKEKVSGLFTDIS